MQNIEKFKQIDILLSIMLFLQIGMKTNTSYDKTASLMLSIVITIYFLRYENLIIRLEHGISYMILWYTGFAGLCAASYLWALNDNTIYIYNLIKDVYIPFILTIICCGVYINHRKGSSIMLLRCLVFAECITILRALLHTPLYRMFTTFDSKLYGSGLGVNYNHYTSQLTLVFIICCFLGGYYSKRFRRIAVFFALNLLISASRKAIIVSVIGIVLLYIFSGERRDIISKIKRTFVVIIVVALFLLLILKVPALYSFIGEKLILALNTIGRDASEIASRQVIDHSAHGRAVLRTEALHQFFSHPILGLGYYCFTFHNHYGLYAHNNYLELLADLGIVGFVIYYSYYVYSFFVTRKKFKQYKNNLHILYYVFMSCLLIMEYGHISMFRLYVLIPLMVLFVSCICMKDDNSEVV